MAKVAKVIQSIYDENRVKETILYHVEKYNDTSYKIYKTITKLSLNELGICAKIPKIFKGNASYLTKEELDDMVSPWCAKQIDKILQETKMAYFMLLTYNELEFPFIARKENGIVFFDTFSDNETAIYSCVDKAANVFKTLIGR